MKELQFKLKNNGLIFFLCLFLAWGFGLNLSGGVVEAQAPTGPPDGAPRYDFLTSHVDISFYAKKGQVTHAWLEQPDFSRANNYRGWRYYHDTKEKIYRLLDRKPQTVRIYDEKYEETYIVKELPKLVIDNEINLEEGNLFKLEKGSYRLSFIYDHLKENLNNLVVNEENKKICDAWDEIIKKNLVTDNIKIAPLDGGFKAPEEGVYHFVISSDELSEEDFLRGKDKQRNDRMVQHVTLWTEGSEDGYANHWMRRIIMSQPSVYKAENDLSMEHYILTNNGVQFKVNINEFNGWLSIIDYDSKGLVLKNGRDILRGSYRSGVLDEDGQRIYLQPADERDISNFYRCFLVKPGAETLKYLGLSDIKEPKFKELKFNYVTNQIEIKTENHDGDIPIQLVVKGPLGTEIKELKYNAIAKPNEDGIADIKIDVLFDLPSGNMPYKDKDGKIHAPEGSFINAIAELPSIPELHIVMNDVESLRGGIRVERLNGDEEDRTKIIFNDKPLFQNTIQELKLDDDFNKWCEVYNGGSSSCLIEECSGDPKTFDGTEREIKEKNLKIKIQANMSIFADTSGKDGEVIVDSNASKVRWWNMWSPSYDHGASKAAIEKFCSDEVDKEGFSLNPQQRLSFGDNKLIHTWTPSPSSGDKKEITIYNPKLVLTKTTSPAKFQNVGDVITYTLKVENKGSIKVKEVKIEDALIDDLSHECGDLEVGGVCEVSKSYVITEGDYARGFVHNSATTTGIPDNPEDPDNPPTTGRDEHILPGPSTFTLEKRADVDSFKKAGDMIYYDFIFKNTGKGPIRNLILNDEKLVIVNLEVFPGEELKEGETRIYKHPIPYEVKDSDVQARRVHNIAKAKGEFIPDPNKPEETSPFEPPTAEHTVPYKDGEMPQDDPILQTPALELTKTANYSQLAIVSGTSNDAEGTEGGGDGTGTEGDGDGTGTEGDGDGNGTEGDSGTRGETPTPATTKTVVYRFIFENTGNTELSKFVLNDEKLGIVNKTVLENVILQPGDRAIHEETVEIPVSGDNLGENFINTASGFATSSTGQEVFSEGSWTIAYGDKDIPVPEGEELSSYTFQKSSREKTAKVGEKVHFLFTYENTGTVTIQNLTLTDVFLGIEDQIIFAELKPGERMTYMVEHTVSEDDVKKPETGADGKPKIYNIATSNGKVPEDPNDPNNPPPLTPPPPSEHEIPLDDPDDGTTIEDPVAKLEFEKTAKCDTLKIQTPTPTITKDDIGKSIIYRFIYTNSGNVELFNLELLDPKLKLHVIAFESILPGEVRIYEYPYQITEADLKQDQLSNIASADADLPEGTKIPDSGNDIPVIPIPDPDPVPEDPVDVPEEPTPTIPQEEDTGIGEEFPYWLDHGHGYDYSVVMPKAKTETASKTSDPKWSSVAVPITGENREITVGISLMALLAAACLMMLRKRH